MLGDSLCRDKGATQSRERRLDVRQCREQVLGSRTTGETRVCCQLRPGGRRQGALAECAAWLGACCQRSRDTYFCSWRRCRHTEQSQVHQCVEKGLAWPLETRGPGWVIYPKTMATGSRGHSLTRMFTLVTNWKPPRHPATGTRQHALELSQRFRNLIALGEITA